MSIISVFAFRFGLFQGDSQTDLASVQYIIRNGFIETANYYISGHYPIIHLYTAFIGLITGYGDVLKIYYIAIWVPTLLSLITTIFIYTIIKKITNDDKSALITSMIWISLAFVSRWMIQFTRTTIGVSVLIIFGYLIIKLYQSNKSVSISILLYIFALVLLFSHPVVSLFGVLSLITIVIYELIRSHVPIKYSKIIDNSPISNKNFTFFAAILTICLVVIWIYYTFLLYPFIHIIHQFYTSYNNLFTDSIIGAIATGSAPSTSYSIASTELRYFGLLRVAFFILMSIIGFTVIIREKKFISVILPLSAFALLFFIINYSGGVGSTTFYRTLVYSSLWLIIATGYLLNKFFKIISNKHIKLIAVLLILIVIILPAPFFTGEVVLPSNWLYSNNPEDVIAYSQGQTPRFIEHYNIDVSVWVNKYTNDNSLIWTEGTHTIGFIAGYGDRDATLMQTEISNTEPIGINVSKLEIYNVNYAVVTDLMRKFMEFPYGGYYTNYDFTQLDTRSLSYQIYDSGRVATYYIDKVPNSEHKTGNIWYTRRD
ncbi:glycosyltransferase family 39 protein [Methanocella paludicola]|nr:glycosyltransferase family 39 protein [Methanocella paludicola]